MSSVFFTTTNGQPQVTTPVVPILSSTIHSALQTAIVSVENRQTDAEYEWNIGGYMDYSNGELYIPTGYNTTVQCRTRIGYPGQLSVWSPVLTIP